MKARALIAASLLCAACPHALPAQVVIGPPPKTDVPAPISVRADPGSPMSWEGCGDVSDLSVVNLRTGNLLTTVPVFMVDPVGPPISLVLYHNGGPKQTTATNPGSIVPGWTHSYSGSIIDAGTKVTVVEDDGRRHVYALASGAYTPPTGVHDRLTFDAAEGEWVLTRPSNETRRFDGSGQLIEVRDSAGNTVTIERPTATQWHIRSAADSSGTPHRITLWLSNGRLVSATDPVGRERYFVYTDAGKLDRVTNDPSALPGNPTGPRDTAFTYDSANRITLVDYRGVYRTQHIYGTQSVIVRALPSSVQGTAYTRTFTVGNTDASLLPTPPDAGTSYWTVYHDRSNAVWRYEFDAAHRLRVIVDPNGARQRFGYDTANNRTSFTNELGYTWQAVFGPAGRQVSLTTPLNATWQMTYEPVGNANTTNVYRLTQTQNPMGHTVTFGYAAAFDPMLVTSIEECPDGQGSGPAVTTIEYYDATTPNATGKIRSVTDANGVVTEFGYDSKGFHESLVEGTEPGRMAVYPREDGWSNNGNGWPVSAIHDAGTDGGQGYDDDGNPVACVYERMRERGVLPLRLGEVPSPQFEDLSQCSGRIDRDLYGRPEYEEGCVFGDHRAAYTTYDSHGNIASLTLQSDESGELLDRTTLYTSYDPEGRVLTRVGPDGDTTTFTYDVAGRLTSATRGGMSVNYFLNGAGLPHLIYFSNGMSEQRSYDPAGRLTEITTMGPDGTVYSVVQYTWDSRDLVTSRTDTDALRGQISLTSFTYDDRGRLIHESRTGTPAYDLHYTYDPMGNRLTKTDGVTGRLTVYQYDTNPAHRDPAFPSNHNRLMRYMEYRDDPTLGHVLERTVRYVYYKTGHASNIIIKDEADPWHRGLALTYSKRGSLWIALWDRWQEPQPGTFTSYERLAAREFRYDQGQRRYLARNVDPTTLAPLDLGGWTHYDGKEPYSDYEVVPARGGVTALDETRYTDSAALEQDTSPAESRFHNSDLIGTTMLATDGAAQPLSVAAAPVLTAFGELIGVTPPETRYGWGGRFGYETGLLTLEGAPGTEPIRLVRTGARWYQPDCGRFVQRDPIGVLGGFNVYAYVHNRPVGAIDPTGLSGVEPLPKIMDMTLKNAFPKWIGGGGTSLTGAGVRGTAARVGATALGTLGGYCVMMATAAHVGYSTGDYIADNTGIDEWIGRQLGTLCPSCWEWVWW